jgi:NAD(P)-dependent dehydrogenase (short-subunit alcohol dehydrogenase family)
MDASANTSSDTGTIASPLLASFSPRMNVAVVGANGGIGTALLEAFGSSAQVEHVLALSRSQISGNVDGINPLPLDLENEETIAAAALAARELVGELHLVVVASGLLHDGDSLQPEKSWKDINSAALERTFRINTIGPALVAKHFMPLLARRTKSVFAALSARVGSIEDNRLGGWYAYRASKAALNMMLKSLSIELSRTRGEAICVGLHPGTVDTALSKPFQRSVSAGGLVCPSQAARNLLDVVDRLTAQDSGGLFAWDGSRIQY